MKNHQLVNSSIQLNGLCLDSFEIANTFDVVYFCYKNDNQHEKFVEICFFQDYSNSRFNEPNCCKNNS